MAITGIPVSGSLLRSDYRLSNLDLGVVLGCIYLGIAVSEILWGVMTDRIGERTVLLTGLISTAAVFGLMAGVIVPSGSKVPGVVPLAGGMLLVGILGGSVNGSSGRAVMAWFQEGQRGLAMSIRQTAMPAGGALGTALLPWIARSHGFRVVYLVLAAVCLMSATATWRWLRQPDEVDAAAALTSARSPAAAKSSGAGPAVAAVTPVSPLRRWDIWSLAFASGLLTFPQIAVLSFSGIFLHDAKHAGLGVVVMTLLVTQIGGGAARIWSGRYTDRHGNRRGAVRVIGTGAGLLMILAAVASDAPTAVVAVVLAVGGLFANAWHGVAYTEIASMAGAKRAGTALGLENTTVFASGFLTPVLIPILLDATSWGVVWGVIGVITLFALPLIPRGVAARPVRGHRSGGAAGPTVQAGGQASGESNSLPEPRGQDPAALAGTLAPHDGVAEPARGASGDVV